MKSVPKHCVLVVDDESSIRDTLALILKAGGYDVRTAKHGLDALSQIKKGAVRVIISDLNMPKMSGFELLSVVRRRFPEIMVIASSGAYESGERIPGGIIADAFYSKGRYRPGELLRMVAYLIETSAVQTRSHRQRSAPVWVSTNGRDSNGIPFVLLTCTECLRSFPQSVLREDVQEIQETGCVFCGNPVRYVIDFSIAVSSPKPQAHDRARMRSADDDQHASSPGD